MTREQVEAALPPGFSIVEADLRVGGVVRLDGPPPTRDAHPWGRSYALFGCTSWRVVDETLRAYLTWRGHPYPSLRQPALF